MSELNFYVAGENDIEKLDTLVNSAYRGESSRKGWTTEADFLDGIRVDQQGLREMIKDKNSVILIASLDNKVNGCVYLQQQQDNTYLGMLTVNPELQAKGLGKKILAKAEDWALQQQSKKIIMTVITLRHELIHWYERNGYQTTGEKKPFPDDPRFGIPKQPLEFVVMEKKLQ
jgi:N-acetylglutamate synthase-like GNAT family acetyltransferase